MLNIVVLNIKYWSIIVINSYKHLIDLNSYCQRGNIWNTNFLHELPPTGDHLFYLYHLTHSTF